MHALSNSRQARGPACGAEAAGDGQKRACEVIVLIGRADALPLKKSRARALP